MRLKSKSALEINEGNLATRIHEKSRDLKFTLHHISVSILKISSIANPEGLIVYLLTQFGLFAYPGYNLFFFFKT
jgi:hypothetical protein